MPDLPDPDPELTRIVYHRTLVVPDAEMASRICSVLLARDETFTIQPGAHGTWTMSLTATGVEAIVRNFATVYASQEPQS